METKKKILIIDDDKIFSKILRDWLTKGDRKYEVTTVFDGEEGFSAASRERPDLILCDLMMPKFGGIEFLKKLRNEAWGKDIPVIIQTQFSDLEKMSEGAELGVRGYIVKSDYLMEDILKQVEEVLK
ncbi:MAG: response regulator [Candidatus Yonathbacteria bacterium]|nr:response regulator [Candidatus Yonathbacteria bacterium]